MPPPGSVSPPWAWVVARRIIIGKGPDKKGIPFMAMVGTNEMGSDQIPVKNLASGEQESMTLEQILALIK